MRFLPDIRYGTENYPEKVARRLRALNLAAWIGAAVAALGFANDVALEFLNPKPGLWKAGVVLSACCVDLGVGAGGRPDAATENNRSTACSESNRDR
jgi:hypothetical protein